MSAECPRNRRFEMVVFLLAVLVVRSIHYWLLPSILYGMSYREALAAKQFLAWGFGNALLPSAPLPSLTLAFLARISGWSPDQWSGPLLLAVQLWLAITYWKWIWQIFRGDDHVSLRRVSFALFLFFPGLNSYEGVRNLASLIAATAALNVIVLVMTERTSGKREFAWLWIIVLSAVVVLCRSEYLILLPFWFLVETLLRRWRMGKFATSPALSQFACVASGLILGILITLCVRRCDAGEWTLANRGYVVYTFLDGSPSSWLTKADDTELERVARGSEHFGDPAEYDYSLRRLVFSHPLVTLEKCILNLPRWCWELGRRHVVFPFPLILIFFLGLVIAFRQRDPDLDGIAIVSLLSMTLPLVGMILYAEYLCIAYPALCAGTAFGLMAVIRSLPKTISPRVSLPLMVLGLSIYCEGALIRGGGFLLDQSGPPTQLAAQIDSRFADASAETIILDPPDRELQSLAKTNFANEYLLNRNSITHFGVIPPGRYFDRSLTDLVTVASQEKSFRDSIDRVIVWQDNQTEEQSMQNRISKWRNLGFEVLEEATATDFVWKILGRERP